MNEDVSWWSDWFPVKEVVRYRQIGRDRKTGKREIRYRSLEEIRNNIGRGKRGRDRKVQPKCKCRHYTYEHEKGSCIKCNCEKFSIKQF